MNLPVDNTNRPTLMSIFKSNIKPWFRHMDKNDFLDLINFFSQINFDGDDEYKYRISILIFAVSHDLRPLVGFEVKLEDFCLTTQDCFNRLNQFFKNKNLNLAVTDVPIFSIYNIKYSIESLRQQSNEDEVQWLGRIFGYPISLTEEEFSNYEVVRNTMNIYVNYNNTSNFLTTSDSLTPINISTEYLQNIRRIFNIIGDVDLELNISTRQPGFEDYQVSTINF